MAENQIGLFDRLRRLFSTDVIIRNVGGNQLKTIDVDKIQAYGNVKTNALIDRFTKLHRYGANMPYNPTMNYQTLRIQLYTDYEAMDTESIIASTLDIISDESTLKNEVGEILQIRSADDNIQRILPADIKALIKRSNYVSNRVYAQYDDTDTELYEYLYIQNGVSQNEFIQNLWAI